MCSSDLIIIRAVTIPGKTIPDDTLDETMLAIPRPIKAKTATDDKAIPNSIKV